MHFPHSKVHGERVSPMEAIDLIHCVPERLAEEVSLGRLLQTAKSIDKWEERQAEVLDYIYRQRLIWLLVGRSSEGELSALYEHLQRMLHPRRLNAMQHLGKSYGDRWSAYRDILESRLASLASDAPQEVLKMAHVEQILDLVLSGRATNQTGLRRARGLKAANLVRVLKIMEANELIERRKVGRENAILPGPTLERIRGKAKAGPSSDVPRRASFLKQAGADPGLPELFRSRGAKSAPHPVERGGPADDASRILT